MNRFRLASLAILIIWLVQAACNMPVEQLPDTGGAGLSSPTPTKPALQTQAVTATPPTAAPVSPTAAPSPQSTPGLSVTVGVVSGIVWNDVCFQGGGTPPAPDVPSGCVLTSENVYQANGFREFNEPGITNLTVSLGAGACPAAGSSPSILATAVTDIDGTYTFAGLVAGMYCVFIDPSAPGNAAMLASGRWTFPSSDFPSQTITLMSGERKTDVNFGWDGRTEMSGAVSASEVSSGNPAVPPGDTPVPTSVPQSSSENEPVAPGNPEQGPENGSAGGTGAVSSSPSASEDSPVNPPFTPQVPAAGLHVPIVGVSFEPGTTSATVEGNLAPGAGEGYALRAGEGYALIATLQSTAGDAVLDVSAEDGTPLQVVSRPDGAYLVSELPSNQRYIVKVIAGSDGSAYTLVLEIPAQISVNQGSGSASGGGTISGGRPVSYLLRGKAGQNLSLSLSSPGSSVSLSISGLKDGQPLASEVTSWAGQLPQTQAYLIQAVPSVESTSFTIQVSLKD